MLRHGTRAQTGLIDALDRWSLDDIVRLTELLHALTRGTTP